MSNKTLNTRIKQKVDTTANWNTKTSFVPLAGEIIYYSDTGKMKIGNGLTTLPNLEFVYVTADDIQSGELIDIVEDVKVDGVSVVDANGVANITSGGSTVSFNRSLSSGTKIGTLTIDGTGTDLYCETDTNTTYSNATTSAAGLMSASDKTKLDGITASADSVSISRSLTSGTKSATITINGTATDLYSVSNSDTKNTTGSSNTSSKIYLVGATSQATNPVTYSHDTAYVGTDGCLYSNSTKVSVEGHTHSYIPTSSKGAASGVAELDSSGKVPQAQLPSYVDDVLEYASQSAFPTTGETGKIYVATDTNKTYRWSGSAYVEISPSLALGTTSSTAYRGDYGAAAYAHGVTNKGIALSSGLYQLTTNAEGHVTAGIAVGIDTAPMASSANLVTSGGVYAMIGDIESALEALL